MTVKWLKSKFEWGARHFSSETTCVIEDNKTEGVRVWFDPNTPAVEFLKFETVRAAKAHANRLYSAA